MEPPKITPKVILMAEHRTDEASRRLQVDGLPDITYTAHSWRRGDTEHTWRPTMATLRWDHGILHAVGLRGFRLKKNGDPGAVPESYGWRVQDGRVRADTRFPGYEAHLQTIVDRWGTVPEFSGPARHRVGS